MDVKELVKECENNAGWRTYGHSFTNNFKHYTNILVLKEINNEEIGKFINICDNRIKHAKTLLKDVAMVQGFAVASASIILSLVAKDEKSIDPIFQFFVGVLLVGIIILFVLLIRYRASVHAWTAFKEGAILNKNYTSYIFKK